MVIPQFVLRELQLVADSADSLKRNRGRRGLDILQRLQKTASVQIQIVEDDFPTVREVDLKLIELAKLYEGKIITNDFNLNKVAQLQGVAVLNINELANSLKPIVLPGEVMRVFILKEGKEYNQGVAYLDDGTMVVVDNARKMIGKTIDVSVTSVLQTTAGKMIFGKWDERGPGRHDAKVRRLRLAGAPPTGIGAARRPGEKANAPGDRPRRRLVLGSVYAAVQRKPDVCTILIVPMKVLSSFLPPDWARAWRRSRPRNLRRKRRANSSRNWAACPFLSTRCASSQLPLPIHEIIVALRPDEIAGFKAQLEKQYPEILRSACGWSKAASIARTRWPALWPTPPPMPEDIVLVHDAVRPFVTPEIIAHVIEAAHKHGAAIAGWPAVDTVKQVERTADGALIKTTIPRASIVMAQTPQGFRYEHSEESL